jgi:RNA polymerase sigma factor (sigma-70 family)
MPLGDRVGEGILGLIRAVRKFKPERGNTFATYAKPWIQAFIERAIRRQVPIIPLTYNAMEIQMALKNELRRLSPHLNTLDIGQLNEQQQKQLADNVSMSVQELIEFQQDVNVVAPRPISLDRSIHEEDNGLLRDMVGDPTSADQLEHTMNSQDVDHLLQQLKDPVQRSIVEWHFGLKPLNGDIEPSVEQIATHLGMTPRQVKYLQKKAIDALRRQGERSMLSADCVKSTSSFVIYDL